MDSSDEEVLLKSCCFLLNYHEEDIKRKRRRTWVRKIFKKIKQGVCHNLLYEIRVNDMNRISSYLFNERFSKIKEVK